MVNAESVANASHRTRVEKSLKEKAIFNYQKFYKSLSSRNFSQKTNERIYFSILTTPQYLKLEFRSQVSSISKSPV